MNNVIVRGLIAWFNDGKRMSALVVAAIGLLIPKMRVWGVPFPEGTEQTLGPWLAAFVVSWLAMSKTDVRVGPSTP